MLKNGALNIYAYGSYAQECLSEISHHCEFDRVKVLVYILVVRRALIDLYASLMKPTSFPGHHANFQKARKRPLMTKLKLSTKWRLMVSAFTL